MVRRPLDVARDVGRPGAVLARMTTTLRRHARVESRAGLRGIVRRTAMMRRLRDITRDAGGLGAVPARMLTMPHCHVMVRPLHDEI